jgi:HAMP domain-containing protein
MRLSPVSIVLFAIVFAVIALPLLTAFFTNVANTLAIIPIPQAKTENDLGKTALKTMSDWIFSLLTNQLALTILVAISMELYAAEQAVKRQQQQ